MLYITVLFLVFAIFVFVKNPLNITSYFLIGSIIGWCMSLLGLLQYLAKLNLSYVIVKYFFYVPFGVWNDLVYSKANIINVIRLINFGTVLFIVCMYLYMIYFIYGYRKPRLASYIPCIILVVQLILYDPEIYRELYKITLSLNILGYDAFNSLYKSFYSFTKVYNLLMLIIPLIFLIMEFLRRKNLPIIREYYFFNLVGLLCIITFHLITFSWAPAILVSIYQRTTYLIYEQPKMIPSFIYYIYPYLSVFCFTIMLFATLKYKSLNKVYSSKHHSKHKILKKNNFGIRALSHSLKNQLLAIQFESEILIDELKDDTDLLETANTINNISKQTIERLNEMHKRIQSQSIILEPAYINDFISQFVNEQVASMTNDTSLNYKLTNLNPRAFIDEEHIGECLNVMIKNAVEAIEANENDDGIISILTEVINDWVIISIQDNGIGMEKEIQSKIFEAFYTTKTGDNNWGIGLSYVKQIIDIHNGNIVVESSKHRGTTIKIMLPLIM
ncbi:hypothetical protein AN1V17_20490 [Vallitalea sediminicola]